MKSALDSNDKAQRDADIAKVYEKVHARFDAENEERLPMIDECLYKLQKYIVRTWLSEEGKRVDGRGIDDLRPLHAEVGLLPKVHGCGLFARGKTQVLTVATLGMISEEQILDGLDDVETKKIHASLQHARLYRRRRKAVKKPRQTRNRSRCAGRARAGAGNSVG